jgi:hypothetical protein
MKQSQIVVNRHPKHQQASVSKERIFPFYVLFRFVAHRFLKLFELTGKAAGIYSITSPFFLLTKAFGYLCLCAYKLTL